MLNKKSGTYILVCSYFLLNGIEFAVILPTLNLFLEKLNASSFFIGFVLSSFSLTGLLSAPIYGRITDISGSTKAAVLFSNLFEIGGNFMYFASKNPPMVLGSRLIAGIGAGSGSSIVGMIARATTEEERTAVFSQILAFRQIGLIIGPAFNLFLRELDFYIGPFHVTSLRAPGLFMALLWLILELLMIFFYHDVYNKKEADYISEGAKGSNPSLNGQNSPNVDIKTNNSEKQTSVSFLSFIYRDLLQEGVIVCLAVNFTLMYVQTGTETLITPLTERLFGWGELENSILFLIVGILMVSTLIAIGWISKRVSDRLMLLTGQAVMVGLYVIFLVFIIFAIKAPKDSTWVLVIFSIHTAILVINFPFIWVSQASLFSKLTSKRTQGFNQGIRILFMGTGQILGPLWAGSLITRIPIMISVNLVLVAGLLVMIAASYNRLKISSESQNADESSEPDERSPLLSAEDNHSINV